jgi:dienelactone hydrolase
MLKRFCCLVFLLLAIDGDSAVVISAEYRIGGVNPEALLCRPNGNGPFPAIVHNHGAGVDSAGYRKAVRRGYDLPGICKELAVDGFVTFIPIRQGGSGLFPHKAQVLEAIDYVRKLPDVDPSRIALTGNSRGALLTLMVGLEQPQLKALVIMAPAEIGRNFSNSLSNVSSLNTPVLLLLEQSDGSEFQNNFDALDSLLREHKKNFKSIRYDRRGGHNLFRHGLLFAGC